MNTIKGVVTQLTEIKSGVSASGYEWASQQVVVEYGDMTPILAAVDFDPDKYPDFAALQRGDEVEISYYPQSTQSKTGGFFTSLRARRLTVIRQAPRTASAPTAAPTPAPETTASTADSTGRRAVNKTAEAPAPAAEESDDLPF